MAQPVDNISNVIEDLTRLFSFDRVNLAVLDLNIPVDSSYDEKIMMILDKMSDSFSNDDMTKAAVFRLADKFGSVSKTCKQVFSTLDHKVKYSEFEKLVLNRFHGKDDKVEGSHYKGHGIEAIDIITSHGLNFNLGNVIKYVLRAPYKNSELEDLKKAAWYINRQIEEIENDYTTR